MRNSEIILCRNIKMDKNYNNVLSYTQNEMISLCRSNAIASNNNYSFIRQNNNTIYSNFTYSQCLQANYIAFQNKDYDNKWFFAFIDEVNYVSDKNTEIKYTIDVFSTFYEDWTAKKCFISRQHCYNDTIGLHTLDENLNISDFETINSFKTDNLANDYYYIIFSTYDGSEDFSGAKLINGAVFGCYILAFDSEPNINNFINRCNKKERIDSILAISYAPKMLIDRIGKTEITITDGLTVIKYYQVDPSANPTGTGRNNAIYDNETVTVEYNYEDYTPKNNRCFCYPYFYLEVSNGVGNSRTYKIEEFKHEIVDNLHLLYLRKEMALSLGCSIRLVPINYKKSQYNYGESLPLAKYPTGAWSGDNWTNWLTENAVNIGGSIGSLAGLGASLYTGNIPLAITSGASFISAVIGAFDPSTMRSADTGGNNNGDVNFSSKNNSFSFKLKRAKLEDLKIIDDYFSRYGYKVNKLEQPNLTHRQNWNYVEIGRDEEIGYGSVPSKYMETINNAFRKGVTIWHNHDNLGNFNLDNDII